MSEDSDRGTVPVRVARGIAGALAIAAIVGGAVVAGITLFSGRSGEPEPTLDPDLVAVAVLENQTGDASLDPLGRQTAARITEAVHRHGVAEIVAVERAPAPAEGDGSEGPEAVGVFARASGAGIVIHGAYYLVADSLQVQVQITDVAKGELMSAVKPVIAPRERPDEAFGVVQERTMAALAAALDYRDGDLNFPTQPPSLAAYRVYRQGDDAHLRGEYEEALGHFEQARAMDSTWMSPPLYVSLTLMNLNRRAESDSVLQAAAAHRHKMSEPEHIIFRGLRSQLDSADPTERLQAVRRLSTIAPGIGLRWGYWLAWQAYRPQESLDFLARVDTESPRFERFENEYWDLSARQHHMLGNHEEELETAREARRRFPGDMVHLRHNLTALSALGRIDEIEALLDTVLSLPETRTGREIVLPHLRTLFVVGELYAHGYSNAAEMVAQRGLGWLDALSPEEVRQDRYGFRYYRADLLYDLGHWEAAFELYEQLVEEFGEDPTFDLADVHASLACAAARLGDVERAQAISAELARRTDEVLRTGSAAPRAAAFLLLGRARIAVAFGEREEAVRLLQEGFRLTRHKGVHVQEAHRHTDFVALHDYLPYQQFLKPRG